MRLLDCFIDIFAYITRLEKTVQAEQPPFDQVKGALDRLLAKSEALASEGNLEREAFDQARFAVCAWVDERLAGSAWQHKQLWLRDQLQRTLFNTTEAGEEFFARLAGLGLQQREVREVYYICLVLGFCGRFCQPGDEYQLEQLKGSNLKLLLGTVEVPALDRQQLFPEAYPAGQVCGLPLRRWGPGPSLASVACLLAPVLAFATLFVIYHYTLGSVTENFLRTVAR